MHSNTRLKSFILIIAFGFGFFANPARSNDQSEKLHNLQAAAQAAAFRIEEFMGSYSTTRIKVLHDLESIFVALDTDMSPALAQEHYYQLQDSIDQLRSAANELHDLVHQRRTSLGNFLAFSSGSSPFTENSLDVFTDDILSKLQLEIDALLKLKNSHQKLCQFLEASDDTVNQQEVTLRLKLNTQMSEFSNLKLEINAAFDQFLARVHRLETSNKIGELPLVAVTVFLSASAGYAIFAGLKTFWHQRAQIMEHDAQFSAMRAKLLQQDLKRLEDAVNREKMKFKTLMRPPCAPMQADEDEDDAIDLGDGTDGAGLGIVHSSTSSVQRDFEQSVQSGAQRLGIVKPRQKKKIGHRLKYPLPEKKIEKELVVVQSPAFENQLASLDDRTRRQLFEKIDDLDREGVAKYLRKIELKKFPTAKIGLLEWRWNDGTRVYFFVHVGARVRTLVLLEIGDKNSQHDDIKRTDKLAEDYFSTRDA